MADIVQLKNTNNIPIYPVTTGEAVTMKDTEGNQTSLDEAFASKAGEMDGKYSSFTQTTTATVSGISGRVATLEATAEGLKPVATSGSYNDLTDKPFLAITSISEQTYAVASWEKDSTVRQLSIGELHVATFRGNSTEDRISHLYLPGGGRYIVVSERHTAIMWGGGSVVEDDGSAIILRIS